MNLLKRGIEGKKTLLRVKKWLWKNWNWLYKYTFLSYNIWEYGGPL